MEIIRKENAVAGYLKNVLAFFFLLFKTCITHPIVQISVSPLTCSSSSPYFNSECYQGVHLFATITGCLGLMIMLIVRCIASYLLVDYNFNSDVPFAGFHTGFKSFFLVPKFLIPILSILDFSVKYFSTNFFKGKFEVFFDNWDIHKSADMRGSESYKPSHLQERHQQLHHVLGCDQLPRIFISIP